MDNEIFAPVNQRVGGVSTRAWYCAAFFATAIAMLLALSCGMNEASATEALDEEANWNIAVDPIGKDEGYSCVLYNNSNGLPTSEANAIAETSEGFIWIGSYSGLIRYDGNNFDRVDSTTGIASVVSLYADSKNRLWVGTNDSGAAVMENGKFRMYNKSDGLQSLSIRSITEDSEGNIYSTYNPDSKWDWWTVGGRFNKQLQVGKRLVSQAFVEDIDFSQDEETYKDALDFWDVVIDGKPSTKGKNYFTLFSKQYYLDYYGNRETYARYMSHFRTYAVITPDGKWYSEGNMGWFGCSSATPEEFRKWCEHYKEIFLDKADPKWILTIVDCHI